MQNVAKNGSVSMWCHVIIDYCDWEQQLVTTIIKIMIIVIFGEPCFDHASRHTYVHANLLTYSPPPTSYLAPH